MGGVGCFQAPTPPSLSQAACPSMGHPPDLPMGWDQGWACQYCLWACVCKRPSWEGWALQGPPAWVHTHCGSEPAGWSHPGLLPGTRPAQGDGASMLLAPAGGSDGTRHKHLEHTCVRTRVTLTDTAWAQMWRTWARTYARYAGAVQAVSWDAPLHAPLHPVAPLGSVGALLWVARHRLQSWAQPQAAWAQPSAAACPTVGQEAGGVLKPGRGVTRQG